jgi:glyoxylase-like metal-dependent hydrolase (beta-lactamase superfamily II)
MQMKIDCLVLGAYQTNCYVLRKNDAAEECLIIDAGLGASELIGFLQGRKLNPVAVVLTHGHIDHIAAVTALRKHYPQIKVYIHTLDGEMLTEPGFNLSALAGRLFRIKSADFLVDDKNIIEHAGIRLTVLHTPGHTPGGICLYSEEEGIVFTDDALFADSVGRTDFPGGSMDTLIESIREKLLVLPDDTKVYPGHGPATTIAEEKSHNPFLR